MKKRILQIASLSPAYLFLVFAFISSSMAFAQEEEKTEGHEKIIVKSNDRDGQASKKVEVTVENGETTVTVTTVDNGSKVIEKYTGKEAEQYLKENETNYHFNQGEEMQWNNDDGEKIIIKEGNATHKVIVIDEDMEVQEDEDIHINMDVDVDVEEVENGKKVTLTYTDEGEEFTKEIIIDTKEILSSVKEIVEALKDFNIDIDFDDLEEGSVHKVIVKKEYIIEDEASAESTNNNLFLDEIDLYPNPSKGVVKLTFVPHAKGQIIITVSDMKGNELFKDQYDGKGEYNKTIDLSGEAPGVYLINISQGENNMVEKVVFE